MPGKLKTYVTSSGFFELAVAAPSMKAALEIWGGNRDLFQRGFARQTDDPEIVKATMAKPGVVLRRGVGTRGRFKENAELPSLSALETGDKARPAPKAPRAAKPGIETNDRAADREAAVLYDLAQKRRERERRRAEAAQEKKRKRRQQAIDKAQLALDRARERHGERMADIAQEREKLERSARHEEMRWEQEKLELEAALKRARDV